MWLCICKFHCMGSKLTVIFLESIRQPMKKKIRSDEIWRGMMQPLPIIVPCFLCRRRNLSLTYQHQTTLTTTAQVEMLLATLPLLFGSSYSCVSWRDPWKPVCDGKVRCRAASNCSRRFCHTHPWSLGYHASLQLILKDTAGLAHSYALVMPVFCLDANESLHASGGHASFVPVQLALRSAFGNNNSIVSAINPLDSYTWIRTSS